MGIKFCPTCGSEEITMEAGGITGTWRCNKCGFSGSVFPEKELLDTKKKKKINNKVKK
jgi:ribosomal protein L37AE/L43A